MCLKTLESLKRLYTSYFIIIVYVDWSRINKWKKLNWKIQCKQKLKIQAPIFSSGENVAIAMIVIRQKGKSRFSVCFFIIWFLQSAKLHKTRIGHSCWFMKEFCGHVMVSMRLFDMRLVRKSFADVVSHYLSMKVYPKSTEP